MYSVGHPDPQPSCAIYLSTHRPLHVPDFFAEFHKSWPLGLLEKVGKELHCAFFRCGKSDLSIEMRHEPVPQSISDRVMRSTLHWPLAQQALGGHAAHLLVTSPSPNGNELTRACDLTRAVTALVSATGSLAVCWLAGPALNPTTTFVSTAQEMFGTKLYPLPLWTGACFDPAAATLFTQGMTQFLAPDIYLANQSSPTPLMIDYLFQVAQYVLTAHPHIKDGEKMDSPYGVMKMKIERGPRPGTKKLILESL